MNVEKRCLILLAMALCVAVPSCMTYEESGLPGSAASMAHNQLMYVSEERETFGYYRIRTLVEQQPDLGLFVRQRGMPEFLAETTNDGVHYSILYYLSDREAFASRPRIGEARSLEFSGPYPITPREVRILENLRDRRPDATGAAWTGVKREGAPEWQ